MGCEFAGSYLTLMLAQRTYSFADLPDADLVIDAIYQGGPKPNASADPLARLLPVGNR